MVTDFLSSENNILLSRALLKFLKFVSGNFFKKNLIPAYENWFSGYWKLVFFIFWILLLMKAIFRLVQTYFWTKFSFPRKPFSLTSSFFLQVETVTEISGNPFFWGKNLFRLVERDFLSIKIVFLYFMLLSCKWKLLLKLVETSSLRFL